MVEGPAMPILRINATSAGLTLHNTPQPAARKLRSMAALPGPAIIMVHGYKYDPNTIEHCPHRKIFSAGTTSWPARLGFHKGDAEEGLGIALGWFARGSLKQAHARAAELGQSIAIIVALLRAHRPHRPVHVIAHSIGSEVALSALAHLPLGAIDRMVLLTGASYSGKALKLLNTPAGRSVEVLNVTSRENDIFDAGFECLVRPETRNDCAIGQGIQAHNVANVQLDCDATLQILNQLGFSVASSGKRVCHWSSYRRAGVMALYSAFMRAPENMPLEHLARCLPAVPEPRWSRLFAKPTRTHRPKEISLALDARTVSSGRPPLATVFSTGHRNGPTY